MTPPEGGRVITGPVPAGGAPDEPAVPTLTVPLPDAARLEIRSRYMFGDDTERRWLAGRATLPLPDPARLKLTPDQARELFLSLVRETDLALAGPTVEGQADDEESEVERLRAERDHARQIAMELETQISLVRERCEWWVQRAARNDWSFPDWVSGIRGAIRLTPDGQVQP